MSCGTSARSRIPGRSASWPAEPAERVLRQLALEDAGLGSHFSVNFGWWCVRLKLPGLPSTDSSRSTRQIGLPTAIGTAE